MGDEVGEVYKFGVRPFRWYLHSHTHVEKLKLIFDFASKYQFWHPLIDFAIVKSILAIISVLSSWTFSTDIIPKLFPTLQLNKSTWTTTLNNTHEDFNYVTIVWKTIIVNPSILK